MENEKWRSEFIRFLKEHNAFCGFVRNFNDPFETKCRINWCAGSGSVFPTKPNGSFKEYWDKCVRKEELLSYAFTWGHTIEGDAFWYKLSNEWRIKVKDF